MSCKRRSQIKCLEDSLQDRSGESVIQDGCKQFYFSCSNILLCFIAAAGSYYAAQTQSFPFVQPTAFLLLVPQQVPSQAASGSKCPPKRERKLVVTTKSLHVTYPRSKGWKNNTTVYSDDYGQNIKTVVTENGCSLSEQRHMMASLAFTSMSWQIRIRDPNQGGRDITEEIMSGVWSATAKDAPQVCKVSLWIQPWAAAAGVAPQWLNMLNDNTRQE